MNSVIQSDELFLIDLGFHLEYVPQLYQVVFAREMMHFVKTVQRNQQHVNGSANVRHSLLELFQCSDRQIGSLIIFQFFQLTGGLDVDFLEVLRVELSVEILRGHFVHVDVV